MSYGCADGGTSSFTFAPTHWLQNASYSLTACNFYADASVNAACWYCLVCHRRDYTIPTHQRLMIINHSWWDNIFDVNCYTVTWPLISDAKWIRPYSAVPRCPSSAKNRRMKEKIAAAKSANATEAMLLEKSEEVCTLHSRMPLCFVCTSSTAYHVRIHCWEVCVGWRGFSSPPSDYWALQLTIYIWLQLILCFFARAHLHLRLSNENGKKGKVCRSESSTRSWQSSIEELKPILRCGDKSAWKLDFEANRKIQQEMVLNVHNLIDDHLMLEWKDGHMIFTSDYLFGNLWFFKSVAVDFLFFRRSCVISILHGNAEYFRCTMYTLLWVARLAASRPQRINKQNKKTT